MSKYHSTRVSFNGHTFDSKKEYLYYVELCLLKRAGAVKKIELQPQFELQKGFTWKGKKIRKITYRADFRVTYCDGIIEVVDVKGMRTPVYLLKKKLLLFKYPEINFVEA